MLSGKGQGLILGPPPYSHILASPEEVTAVSEKNKSFSFLFFNPKKNVHNYDLLLSHINNNGSGVQWTLI